MTETKKLTAIFYHTAAGTEPVREWLRDFDVDDRRRLGLAIAKIEFNWPVGMPACRPMGEGLFEVRSNISSGRIARVLFGLVAGHMVLLHGFVKKTQATPQDDLELARKRLKEVQ